MLQRDRKMYRQFKTSFVSLTALGSLVLICVFVSDAFAQAGAAAKYDVISIPPAFDDRPLPTDLDRNSEAYKTAKDALTLAKKTRRTFRDNVMSVLGGGAPINSDFRNWFEKVIFAEMTQTDPEGLQQIPKKRQEFFRYYLQKSGVPPNVHEELYKLAGTKMREIVQGNYHPAVRYNAMLIIGELNEQEAAGANSPAVPLVSILRPILLAEFTNAGQIEAVRVAALLGILRHAELDGRRPASQRRIAVADRDAIVSEMLKLLTTKDPPKGRTEGAHRWMQRRAIDVLGALRSEGKAGEVTAELVRIIRDAKLPISYRCTAAAAIGQLELKSNKVNVRKGIESLVALALSACEGEIARLESARAELTKKPTGIRRGPVGTRNVLGGAVATDAQEYQLLVISRRMLKHHIRCIQLGVGDNETTGLRQYAKAEPDNKYALSAVKALNDLMKATDKQRKRGERPEDEEEFTADMLIASMRINLGELNRLVVRVKPKAADDTEKLPSGPESPPGLPPAGP